MMHFYEIKIMVLILSFLKTHVIYYSTKQVSRYRSPEVIELCKELDQEQERLLEFANEAWEEFLM